VFNNDVKAANHYGDVLNKGPKRKLHYFELLDCRIVVALGGLLIEAKIDSTGCVHIMVKILRISIFF